MGPAPMLRVRPRIRRSLVRVARDCGYPQPGSAHDVECRPPTPCIGLLYIRLPPYDSGWHVRACEEIATNRRRSGAAVRPEEGGGGLSRDAVAEFVPLVHGRLGLPPVSFIIFSLSSCLSIGPLIAVCCQA
jgi:hypothetical protein